MISPAEHSDKCILLFCKRLNKLHDFYFEKVESLMSTNTLIKRLKFISKEIVTGVIFYIFII